MIKKTNRFFNEVFLSFIALYSWLTPTIYIATKILLPLTQILFFIIWTRLIGNYSIEYILLGNLLQITALSTVFGVIMSIGNERLFGTLPLVILNIKSHLYFLITRVCFHLIDGFITLVFFYMFAQLFVDFDFRIDNLPLMIAGIGVMVFATSGIGIIMGSVSLIVRDIWLIANTLYMMLLALVGVNFSIELLPRGLRFISFCLPMTRSIKVIRMSLQQIPMNGAYVLLFQEFVLGIFYWLSGYFVFKLLVNISYKKGTLEIY